MMKYKVKIKNLSNHEVRDCIIEEIESESIALTLQLDDEAITVNNDGYFEAFQELIDILLAKNYGFLCKGAMINATQSPMGSGTNKIYLTTLGKQARMNDLVNLYEYVDLIEFPSAQMQQDFHQDWIKSLGSVQ